MSGLRMSARDIAPALDMKQTAVLNRAKRESWPFLEAKGRGGTTKFFDVARLPEDVRAALRRHHLTQAAPAEDDAPATRPTPRQPAPPPTVKAEQMRLPFDEERPDVRAFQARCLEARAAICAEVDRLLNTGLAQIAEPGRHRSGSAGASR